MKNKTSHVSAHLQKYFMRYIDFFLTSYNFDFAIVSFSEILKIFKKELPSPTWLRHIERSTAHCQVCEDVCYVNPKDNFWHNPAKLNKMVSHVVDLKIVRWLMVKCVVRHILTILFAYFWKNIHKWNCTVKWLAVVAKIAML